MSNKILQTQTKRLSNEILIVWHWFDLSDRNPYYVFGEDENVPICCTYKNGKLVATVFWNFDVKLETVAHFLETTKDYIRIPMQYHRCPCEEL